jgi:LmbE family N-acetylglucosaminyl deacetylase
MLDLTFFGSDGPSCVLLLGAHCDDLEIGCGGTILQMAERWPRTRFVWITLSSDTERAAETQAAAGRLLHGVENAVVCIEQFRGSYFPYDGAQLKEYIETLKAYEPDLILTHYRHDLHQDHRITNELTWNTFRNHLILEYEIPKFDGDVGTPNTYIPLSLKHLQAKIQILLDCFPSQMHRKWYTQSTFEAIARLRGIECNAPEGYAEAFYGRKNRLHW